MFISLRLFLIFAYLYLFDMGIQFFFLLFFFIQNIDFVYSLDSEAVVMRTHNQCFEQNIYIKKYRFLNDFFFNFYSNFSSIFTAKNHVYS